MGSSCSLPARTFLEAVDNPGDPSKEPLTREGQSQSEGQQLRVLSKPMQRWHAIILSSLSVTHTNRGTVQEDSVDTRSRDSWLGTFYSLSAFAGLLCQRSRQLFPAGYSSPHSLQLPRNSRVSLPPLPFLSEADSLHFLLHFRDVFSTSPSPTIPVRPLASGPYSSFFPPHTHSASTPTKLQTLSLF